MTVEAWLAAAIADAEQRGLPDLKPLLEALARATAHLRSMDSQPSFGGGIVGRDGNPVVNAVEQPASSIAAIAPAANNRCKLIGYCFGFAGADGAATAGDGAGAAPAGGAAAEPDCAADAAGPPAASNLTCT